MYTNSLFRHGLNILGVIAWVVFIFVVFIIQTTIMTVIVIGFFIGSFFRGIDFIEERSITDDLRTRNELLWCSGPVWWGIILFNNLIHRRKVDN